MGSGTAMSTFFLILYIYIYIYIYRIRKNIHKLNKERVKNWMDGINSKSTIEWDLQLYK